MDVELLCRWCRRRCTKVDCVVLHQPDEVALESGYCTCFYHETCAQHQLQFDRDGHRLVYPDLPGYPTDCIAQTAQHCHQPIFYCHKCIAMGDRLVRLLPVCCLYCEEAETTGDDVVCRSCTAVLCQTMIRRIGTEVLFADDLADVLLDLSENSKYGLNFPLRRQHTIVQKLVMQTVVRYLQASPSTPGNLYLNIQLDTVMVKTVETVLCEAWLAILEESATLNLGVYVQQHLTWDVHYLARGRETVYRRAIDAAWKLIVLNGHPQLGPAGTAMGACTDLARRVITIKKGQPHDIDSLYQHLRLQPPYTGQPLSGLVQFYPDAYEDLLDLERQDKIYILHRQAVPDPVVFVYDPPEAVQDDAFRDYWLGIETTS